MRAPSPALRGGLRRGPDPYRQGDLDSLCGIYAIINVMSALCPALDDHRATALFEKLVRSLSSFVEEPIEVLYLGIDDATLRHLLTIAKSDIERRLKVVLEVRPYRRAKGRVSLPDFWDRMMDELSERQVAIVSVRGPKDHWTVVHGINPDAIALVDSADLRTLPRKRITLSAAKKRYWLDLSEVIFVERID